MGQHFPNTNINQYMLVYKMLLCIIN